MTPEVESAFAKYVLDASLGGLETPEAKARIRNATKELTAEIARARDARNRGQPARMAAFSGPSAMFAAPGTDRDGYGALDPVAAVKMASTWRNRNGRRSYSI